MHLFDIPKSAGDDAPLADPPIVILRDIPLIAEIEGMLDIRGIEWRADFDAKCDEVSIALFGITKADTIRPEPHPDQFGGASRYFFGDKELSQYDQALAAWYQWQEDFFLPADDEDVWLEEEIIDFWRDTGFDVLDAKGAILRCLHRFERQLLAVGDGLIATARLTIDGSGSRAAADADAWGKSLEEAAARFKSSRR